MKVKLNPMIKCLLASNHTEAQVGADLQRAYVYDIIYIIKFLVRGEMDMQHSIILTDRQTDNISNISVSNFIIMILRAFAVMRNVKFVCG